ncbi:galactokinase family protein [Demequina sp.]|uniref:galactokinase n=1 Tax=Demequina sp. TaxID=2050685 RepID=UPI0025E5905E|nr:galactokinase family protein [Demequina sp.]
MTGPATEDTPRWLQPWSLDEGSDRARSLFAQEFGGEPGTVVSAPGRITVIGDHTDYSRGLALATVTAHRTFVAARRRDDEAIRVVNAQGDALRGPGRRWEGTLSSLEPGDQGWPSRPAGIVWALTERGYPATGLDIAIDSCLPSRAGLGSAASVIAAVGLACEAAWGLALDNEEGTIELAEAGWEAESAFVGFPGGRLDSHAVLRCREGGAALLDFATAPPTVTHYPWYFGDYGLRLLVIDTGSRRPDWAEAYARRSRDSAQAAAALGVPSLRDLATSGDALARVASLADDTLRRRAHHIVTEDERVRETIAALGGLGPAHDRFSEIGTLMLESHRSLRADYDASTPELDLAVDTAFGAGALGARLAGAGFGGCAVALARSTAVPAVADEVDAMLFAKGFARPQFLLV